MAQFSDINKIFKTNNLKINTLLISGINDIPIQLTLLFTDVSVNLLQKCLSCHVCIPCKSYRRHGIAYMLRNLKQSLRVFKSECFTLETYLRNKDICGTYCRKECCTSFVLEPVMQLRFQKYYVVFLSPASEK